MSALTEQGRFRHLADDAQCERCGRTLAEHTQGSYGRGLGRVDVLAVCPVAISPFVRRALTGQLPAKVVA